MRVRCCGECPFFRTTVLSLVARGVQAGECSYDAEEDELVADPDQDLSPAEKRAHQERILRRLRVADRRVAPAACPLRRGPVVVQLAQDDAAEAGGLA